MRKGECVNITKPLREQKCTPVFATFNGLPSRAIFHFIFLIEKATRAVCHQKFLLQPQNALEKPHGKLCESEPEIDSYTKLKAFHFNFYVCSILRTF